MSRKDKKSLKNTAKIREDLEHFKSIGNTKMVKILEKCLKRIENSDPNIDGYTRLKEKYK